MSTKFLIPGVAGLVLTLGVLIWAGSSALSASKPTPGELSNILYAHEKFKSPVTATIVTALNETAARGDLDSYALIENYKVGQVLRDLGLATVDFNVVKADEQKCSYIDLPPSIMTSQGWSPTGTFSNCYDVWKYKTNLKLAEPETVDRTALIERSQSTQFSERLDAPTRKGMIAAGSDKVNIGTVEILEVSDMITGYRGDTYFVGFRYRFKPNALGEVFDTASSVHKALPKGVAKAFVEELSDERLSALKYEGSGQVDMGYAILGKTGTLKTQWQIKQIFFNSASNYEFAYHRLSK